MLVKGLTLLVGVGLLATSSALYSKGSKVIQLTDKDFSQVTKGDELWLVEFYAPWCGHCKNLAPEWEKAAGQLAGVVKVAAVDANEYQALGGKYGVQGFPTIKVFGAKKSAPTNYEGPRTAAGIVDFALKEVNSLVRARSGGAKKEKKEDAGSKKSKGSSGGSKGDDAVITLTDDNFDDLVLNSKDTWFVEFYAPWCGHCKALAPEWANAAGQLKGQVKLGALDATVNQAVASRFAIKGYPTIKVFPGGTAKSDGDAEDYTGPRTAGDIVTAALAAAEKSGSGASVEVAELVNQEVFDENCSGKRICVIAFFKDILDDGKVQRNAYISMLQAVGKRQRGRPFRFLWTASGKQPALEKALGPFDAPSIIAVTAEKKLFTIHLGSLAEDSVAKFCERLMTGRAGDTKSLSELPKIDTVAPWDGEDGKLEAVEEFSLEDLDL